MDGFWQVYRTLLESIFGGEIGSDRFTIMFSVPMFGALIVAWFLSKAFGSKRGLVGSIIALLLPLMIGLAAYTVVAVFVVPELGQPWAGDYLAWAALALFTLLSVMLVSRRIWDIAALAAVVVVVFALSAATMGYFAIDSMMHLSEQADDTATDRQQILEDAGK